MRLPIVSLLSIATFAVPAQDGARQPSLTERYVATEHMVAMRDGIHLHTIVVTPRQAQEPLPVLMLRTPYGVANWQRHFASYMKELAEDGYVFAFQDIRGRFGSEGQFVMQRPLHTTDASLTIDECTDAWDTIDWLVKNVDHNNGRVGMLGISYDGWTTIMAAVDPHPALRAISPQASPADMWLGDDFHHNGAFRLSYGFEYAAMMETSKTTEAFRFDRYDTFDWYLRLGPLRNVNEHFLQGRIPTWNDYVAHPDYDAFWRAQTVVPQLTSCTVPTLNVAGWWDQEDFYGPLAIYRALEQHDDKGINHLVVGPWNHGGWSRGAGDRLGAIPFGSNTAAWFREHVQAVWFRHWLKDQGKLELPEALTFEAGSNEWRRWDAWPPKGTTPKPLYFHDGGLLSFDAPVATDDAEACDAFVSDPAHPVPYRRRPIQATYGPGSTWREWLTEDQRFVKDRPDVLTWETDVLDADVTIAGEITAKLFASTTGRDADWIVKLIDVYPEDGSQGPLAGHCLMVANEVFRGRYRRSFEKPEPLPAGEVVPFTIGLHTQDHTWKKGHRIMVQVQSTWFPLIDRNPQTWVPDIFAANEADFRAQTHRVFRSARFASCVVLPVVGR
ncbi:MAG TPA: CocE/NonD family hydrolase [Planctomycetota bacterium]|nr:CocE/NonD family hydrolase [Planctomycetota bacterium]